MDTRECPHCAEDIKVRAKVCKHCGRDVEPVPVKPVPVEVAPEPKPVKHGTAVSPVKLFGGFAVAVPFIFCALMCVAGPSSGERKAARAERRAQDAAETEQREAVKASAKAASAEAWQALPESQRLFCDILLAHQTLYARADNDLKRSAVRRDRAAALRTVPRTVEGWQGKIVELTTTGDGLGVLEVEMPQKCSDFQVRTWNNAFSGLTHKTLIDPDSATFASLSTMSEGQTLTFGGSFIPDDVNGYAGTSLTERGSMTGEHFAFRFGR